MTSTGRRTLTLQMVKYQSLGVQSESSSWTLLSVSSSKWVGGSGSKDKVCWAVRDRRGGGASVWRDTGQATSSNLLCSKHKAHTHLQRLTNWWFDNLLHFLFTHTHTHTFRFLKKANTGNHFYQKLHPEDLLYLQSSMPDEPEEEKEKKRKKEHVVCFGWVLLNHVQY